MLRPVIFQPHIVAFATSLTLLTPAMAQETADPRPESLENITEIERAAREAGQALDLPDTPDMSLLGDLDIPEWNDLLKTLPQLREVLPLDGVEGIDPAADAERQELSEYSVVLVSLSMPEESLRQISEQAREYGFSTVMRGLVNNSFADTLSSLTEVFEGDTENMPGISIDPTVFTRFDVEAVPAFIFLAEPLEPCETQGCTGDPAPEHDILYGNVSFEYAAEWVANADGPGSDAAQIILNKSEDVQ